MRPWSPLPGSSHLNAEPLTERRLTRHRIQEDVQQAELKIPLICQMPRTMNNQRATDFILVNLVFNHITDGVYQEPFTDNSGDLCSSLSSDTPEKLAMAK
ncbi:hypothetical protein STEG23_022780, partial [Scotinomys teguina]